MTQLRRPPARAGGFCFDPLPGSPFGTLARAESGAGLAAVMAAAERSPDVLPAAMDAADGLLVLRGLLEIASAPRRLVELSRLFGPEVEDYRLALVPASMVHPEVPEILIVSNVAPVSRQPPARPVPPLTADGRLPTQFPHRRGWHSDQSYRRPPPDVSLFYAMQPTPQGQGQTLYANGIAAYEALPPELARQVEGLVGLHTRSGTGRTEQAVRAGETPRPLAPHERPQRQPVVRVHPVTGRRALFLCEAGQMDWVDGPFVGMEPGPDGAGAELLYALMRHATDPRFTYTHEWERGDLVIYDNRTVLHTATWFDATAHERVMWRTTVMGNPGPEYAGEARSWLVRSS
ncbi:MAG: TauD/TfdA family dioxygenase [Ectothiorhodospiraceae bacterium]|nr:TauD/TfdA family dioxygenase [Ectothiorhodospiraceae bacterium]